jgi:GPH family glycoside/pentoside/hexuronide:cation symporter
MIYDTFFTIYIMAYMALLPQMTINPNERMKVQIVGFFINLVPSVATLLIPLILLEEASPKLVNPSPVLWQMAMFFIAIAIMVTCAIPAFFFKERPELHPSEEKPLGVLKSIITSLKSGPFLMLLVFNFIAMWLGAAVATIMIYYIDHYLELTGLLALLALAVPGLAGIAVVPVAYYLNRKYGSRKTVILMGLISLIGFIIIFFTEEFIVLLIAVGLAATGISTYNLMFNIMFGDIVDEDELKTNQRREGMFYGMNAVVSKPAESLGVAAVMFILVISGYIEGTGTHQSPSALFGIKIAASVLPALLVVGMLVFLLLYPLHGERFRKMKEQVNNLHQEKRKKLEKQGN